MSDTPRTDEATIPWHAKGCEQDDKVPVSFARQLERELNASNKIKEKASSYAAMSDSELRLRCGELTAQEIRTIRAVLNNILTP